MTLAGDERERVRHAEPAQEAMEAGVLLGEPVGSADVERDAGVVGPEGGGEVRRVELRGVDVPGVGAGEEHGWRVGREVPRPRLDRAELVAVVEGDVHRAVAPHREAGDGAGGPPAGQRVALLEVAHEVSLDVRLPAIRGLERRVRPLRVLVVGVAALWEGRDERDRPPRGDEHLEALRDPQAAHRLRRARHAVEEDREGVGGAGLHRRRRVDEHADDAAQGVRVEPPGHEGAAERRGKGGGGDRR